MNDVFKILAVVFIIMQTFHSWFAFDSFNNLPKEWMRRTQNAFSCGSIGVLIMAFVAYDYVWLAIGSAMVEFLFNIYYYQNSDCDKRSSKAKRAQWLKWWVLSWLFPAGIAICSHLAFAP